jgi:hypothetical protein
MSARPKPVSEPDTLDDASIERALDYLRDQADAAAQARAERVYVIEYRKSLKAQLMAEHGLEPLGAQEREAYADPRYVEHLQAMRQAVYVDERHTFLRQAAEARFEAWRTMNANRRAVSKL